MQKKNIIILEKMNETKKCINFYSNRIKKAELGKVLQLSNKNVLISLDFDFFINLKSKNVNVSSSIFRILKNFY